MTNLKLQQDFEILKNYAKQTLPLADAALAPEYYYQSLPLCVIDAVFSIGVRYSGVKRVVERYCEYTNQLRIRSSRTALPPRDEQESITHFCHRPEQADYEAMATLVNKSRQRTSTKNGILKSVAVHRFAMVLQSNGVEYLQDVARVANADDFKSRILEIPGQGSGICLQYFWMLTGSDQFIKPDRMVLRFLSSALSRTVSIEEASDLIRGTCDSLQSEHPDLTPRMLDHEIWKFQSRFGTPFRPTKSEFTLEGLATRLDALERRLDFATTSTVIPPSRDWQSVVGISEENDFTREMYAEIRARREAEREAARLGVEE